jgi:hypothetical protein
MTNPCMRASAVWSGSSSKFSRLLKKAHMLRWCPRPHVQRTESTPRVRPSGAASHLGLFEQPAGFSASYPAIPTSAVGVARRRDRRGVAPRVCTDQIECCRRKSRCSADLRSPTFCGAPIEESCRYISRASSRGNFRVPRTIEGAPDTGRDHVAQSE